MNKATVSGVYQGLYTAYDEDPLPHSPLTKGKHNSYEGSFQMRAYIR